MAASININASLQNTARKNIYKSALNALYAKKKIWNKINEERLLHQKEKVLEQERLTNKKIYALYGKKYYKLLGDNVEYYALEKSMKDFPASQFMIEVYRYSFSGMTKKSVLMKVDKLKNQLMISEDTLRVYFKPFKIESIK